MTHQKQLAQALKLMGEALTLLGKEIMQDALDHENSPSEGLENEKGIPVHKDQIDLPKAEELAPETKAKVEPEENPIKLEDVRAVLAQLAQAGKRAAVKELLQKYGASKLSEVKPNDYASLTADAEAV